MHEVKLLPDHLVRYAIWIDQALQNSMRLDLGRILYTQGLEQRVNLHEMVSVALPVVHELLLVVDLSQN